MSDKFKQATKQNQTLRYLASVTPTRIRVGLEKVDLDSPFGRLRGCDNQVCIYTNRYKESPLLLTGPGAGAEVTASGVLSDIIALGLSED